MERRIIRKNKRIYKIDAEVFHLNLDPKVASNKSDLPVLRRSQTGRSEAGEMSLTSQNPLKLEDEIVKCLTGPVGLLESEREAAKTKQVCSLTTRGGEKNARGRKKKGEQQDTEKGERQKGGVGSKPPERLSLWT